MFRHRAGCFPAGCNRLIGEAHDLLVVCAAVFVVVLLLWCLLCLMCVLRVPTRKEDLNVSLLFDISNMWAGVAVAAPERKFGQRFNNMAGNTSSSPTNVSVCF